VVGFPAFFVELGAMHRPCMSSVERKRATAPPAVNHNLFASAAAFPKGWCVWYWYTVCMQPAAVTYLSLTHKILVRAIIN
jgi:NADH:ubiquinone oxidoreductase subunit